jgi:hypothetical protein
VVTSRIKPVFLVRRGAAGKQAATALHQLSFCLDMAFISISDLEAAINFWRGRSPSQGDELSLCKEASALSKPYALLIVQRQSGLPPEQLDDDARAAWEHYARFKIGLQA